MTQSGPPKVLLLGDSGAGKTSFLAALDYYIMVSPRRIKLDDTYSLRIFGQSKSDDFPIFPQSADGYGPRTDVYNTLRREEYQTRFKIKLLRDQEEVSVKGVDLTFVDNRGGGIFEAFMNARPARMKANYPELTDDIDTSQSIIVFVNLVDYVYRKYMVPQMYAAQVGQIHLTENPFRAGPMLHIQGILDFLASYFEQEGVRNKRILLVGTKMDALDALVRFYKEDRQLDKAQLPPGLQALLGEDGRLSLPRLKDALVRDIEEVNDGRLDLLCLLLTTFCANTSTNQQFSIHHAPGQVVGSLGTSHTISRLQEVNITNALLLSVIADGRFFFPSLSVHSNKAAQAIRRTFWEQQHEPIRRAWNQYVARVHGQTISHFFGASGR